MRFIEYVYKRHYIQHQSNQLIIWIFYKLMLTAYRISSNLTDMRECYTSAPEAIVCVGPLFQTL